MNEETQHEPTKLSSKTICFPLGQIVATPGALELFDRGAVNAADLIRRHQSGDWGNVPPEDAEENERSIVNGFRILSSYLIGEERIWVITEADRSSTTLLLPEEY
ncbi:MAG: type I restriction endonuclease subunit M [Sideroxydans sp.]|nr:type I restriction endonuclease subunit M [Sideroxydans sp.]